MIVEARKQRETGSIVPWAFGPRPLFLANYILALQATDEPDAAFIAKIRTALESEVANRPEFADNPVVVEALGV